MYYNAFGLSMIDVMTHSARKSTHSPENITIISLILNSCNSSISFMFVLVLINVFLVNIALLFVRTLQFSSEIVMK